MINFLKKLFLEEIADKYIQENFRRLREYLTLEPLLRGRFYFFEIGVSGAVTDQKFAHNLGFPPQDVLQTSLVGPGTLTWKYDQFTRDFLVFSTTDKCTVRVYIGSFNKLT